jgi:bisphosphoglycerate-dependent phosphoglycerate mutase
LADAGLFGVEADHLDHDATARTQIRGLAKDLGLAVTGSSDEPYWHETISADLTQGAVVLVVAHGNSLRALVKYLDGLDESELGSLELAVGHPRVYRFERSSGAEGSLPSVLIGR